MALIDNTDAPQPFSRTVIHQVFLVDASTSMMPLKDEVNSSIQQMIRDLKENEQNLTRVTTRISFITFNTDTTIHVKDEPISEYINSFEYMPSGMTALFDALLYTQEMMKAQLFKELQKSSFDRSIPVVGHKIIINLFTDGAENASQHCSDGNAIINSMKESRWVVNTFGLGAGGIAQASSLNSTNTVTFDSLDEDSVRSSVVRTRTAAINYSIALEKGLDPNYDL